MAIDRIDVACEQRCGIGIGARDEHGRHVEHVGGKPRGDEVLDRRLRWDEHLAAEVAALFLRGELIFEMHARSASLDHGFGQLVHVERAAEARFHVGHDRREPVGCGVALEVVDLIGAGERVIDAAHDIGHAIGRLQTLIGIHLPRAVCMGGDLPAAQVNRLDPGFDSLHPAQVFGSKRRT